MEWFLPVLLLAGSSVAGDHPPETVIGKVVAVPDGGSVWVYLEDAQASYHFTLDGIKAPPLTQPEGQVARNALAQLVLGKEVKVAVQHLSNEGEIPGTVFLGGQSVNTQMARLLSPRETQPRRPLLAFCSMLRSLSPLPWKNRAEPAALRPQN